MDELAKKLSVISFGVIGVICLIGVIQKRSWLEMFTIGGEPRTTVDFTRARLT
jgi:Ca2+-transporting ATPase